MGYGPAFAFAFFLWLAFVLPIYLNFLGWEGKPVKLIAIHTGYWLVYLLIAAALIVAFI